MTTFEPIIGLEVHVELKTKSKMFCSCPADWFSKPPNSLTCPVCLGLPGALPVANGKAIESVVQLGLALNCTINTVSKFDRKHYLYPDLPKGFQISQYDVPFCVDGKYDLLDNELKTTKTIRIKRVHMEEDTGNLKHSGNQTLVDFNRSGVPLVEIVTEPDFENALQVKQFLEELQVMVKYLDISDGNMDEGSMRLEPNISVRVLNRLDVPRGTRYDLPNYKVEVKNINSFKFARHAIDYEIERHIDLLKKGITPTQETRGFNEATKKTVSQRTKEDAHDYRYFPEPDIPPIRLEKKYIDELQQSLTELPNDTLRRFITHLHIKYQNAFILTRNLTTAKLFEDILENIRHNHRLIDTKDKKCSVDVSNLIVNKKVDITQPFKQIVSRIILLLNTEEIDFALIDSAIKKVLHDYPIEVASYKKGKKSVIMFLVGVIMREINGKADGNTIRIQLEKKLST